MAADKNGFSLNSGGRAWLIKLNKEVAPFGGGGAVVRACVGLS